MIDLKSIVEKYPDSVKDAKKLKAILNDLYPQEKARIRCIVEILEFGIVDQIKNCKENDDLFIKNLCQTLENEYGYSNILAKECIECWKEAYKKEENNGQHESKNYVIKKIASHTIYGTGEILDNYRIGDVEIIRIQFDRGYIRSFKLPDFDLLIKDMLVEKDDLESQNYVNEIGVDDKYKGYVHKVSVDDKYRNYVHEINVDDDERIRERFRQEKKIQRDRYQDYYEGLNPDDMDGMDYMDSEDYDESDYEKVMEEDNYYEPDDMDGFEILDEKDL